MNRVHRHLDPEFLELDLKQMANSREGFRGIVELFLLGRVQNRDRRQGAFNRAVDKQRHLFLFLHTLARLRRFGRCRGNHGRYVFFTLGHVLGQRLFTFDQTFFGLGLLTLVGNAWGDHFVNPGVDLTQLCNQLLALITVRPPAIRGALNQLEQIKGDFAGHVHDLEPRQIGKNSQTEQEQGNQQQGTALNVQRVLRQIPQAFAQRTASTGGQAAGRMEVNVRQRGT